MTLASLSDNIGVALRTASRSFPERIKESQGQKGRLNRKSNKDSEFIRVQDPKKYLEPAKLIKIMNFIK